MEVTTDSYLDHFDQYGCRYYKLPKTEISDLKELDCRWLTQIGLPDAAVPFFFFDFYIAYLRDESFPQAKMVLGTAFEPASRHYLYVHREGHVVIQMECGGELFVNSSIDQLCKSILIYSQWLEQQEELFASNDQHLVDEADMFELYYDLRHCDKEAFEQECAIWPQLVNSEINFLAEEG